MIFPIKRDLWSYLQGTEKTVVMYGMGNGADKILNICQQYGIKVSDFFASDGFVRGHSFHGKTVLSYTQVKEKYGCENLIVLLSFASSLPSVLALFDAVASECEFYAPDVPVCGEALFNLEFAQKHSGELRQVYSLLADDESRRIFENTVAYKLTGRIDCLKAAESDRDEVYSSLLDAKSIRLAADLGAYNGDTVRELMKYAPLLSEVYAMEPDRRNFRKLSEFIQKLGTPTVHAFHGAAWSREERLFFADSGNRNSGAFAPGKQVEVAARSLDSLVGDGWVDYIKYDVEGAEGEALIGSSEVIRRCRPRLLISVYHRSEDLFALPLQLHTMAPDYRLYLRRYPYVPAWDLNLIALPKELN
ncbi:MAG: FkbM family methyltransferase [Clostridia bacterium]|nr:FkbM family methyltransferase [Clostridia bacterium]